MGYWNACARYALGWLEFNEIGRWFGKSKKNTTKSEYMGSLLRNRICHSFFLKIPTAALLVAEPQETSVQKIESKLSSQSPVNSLSY